MGDVRGVFPDGERHGPHHVGGEWLSFEQRMRRRRAATCVQHADRAIADGNVAEARAALTEARELTPGAPEIEALEARLQAIPDARGSRLRIPIAYSLSGFVLLLLTLAGMSFATHFWPGSRDLAGGATPPATHVAASGPVPANMPAVSKTDAAAGLRVIHETVRVPEATPRLVQEMPPLPAMPGPPVADAEPDPEPERQPVVLAVNRAPAPPPPDTPRVRSELPAEALPEPALSVRMAAPPPPDPDPAATSGRNEGAAARGDSTPARSETPDTRTGAASVPSPRDESAVVRGVLQQYERAYSRLDAAAASAVWPAVNRNALARAFDGLASQRVSLGSCDVAIQGPAARATCSGSATWEPKVGGGVHTEARRWNFELKKSGEEWQIERAIARGGG